MGALASALVGAIMSYEAWNNVTFVAGEIRDPRKNIGLSLLTGTLIVTLIYVLLNLMFTAVLPLQAIAAPEKDRVGMAAAQAIFGASGTAVIAILIMIATFGCNNGLILSGARVYYSMANDGLFFRKASVLNKHSVPRFALWMQCAMASVLCLSGKYGDLLDMITFIAVLFYVLTILGVFILRVKQPGLERPYKAVGYPVLPFLYILMGSAFCVLLIIYKPGFTWPGLLISLAGIPVYYLTRDLKPRK
jgi:APA family basic amino acid/polyamine antiporter